MILSLPAIGQADGPDTSRCSTRYAALEGQFRQAQRRKAIEDLVGKLPPDQVDAATQLLQSIPARHPLSLFIDGWRPGREESLQRVLELALLEFDPKRASLLSRASKDLQSLSLEERRALALHLRARWWFDTDVQRLRRVSAIMDPMRVASGALDLWIANGRGPYNPRQLEGLIHDTVNERWHHGLRQAFDRESELRAVARTLQLHPERGRSQLLNFFANERQALQAAANEANGLRRVHLLYLARRLDQLIEYASLPESQWAQVVRRNPAHQQLLFETLPAGLRTAESTAVAMVSVGIPTTLLNWWIESQRAPRRAPELPVLPDPAENPSNSDFSSTDPSPSRIQKETPEQSLIRQLNNEEISQAEFNRRMREIEARRGS